LEIRSEIKEVVLVMDVTFTVTGADTIASNFKSISQKVKDFQASEPKKIADEMVQKMQERAPVDTGFLRDNISVTNSDDTAAQVSSLADYSFFVEFGTRFMAAQPFFYVVFDEYTIQNIIDDFNSVGII
jgi:HK97 gp10 family phage protein